MSTKTDRLLNSKCMHQGNVNTEHNKHQNKSDMIIRMVRGCICNSLNVDGKEEIDMTDKERLVVLKAISEHLKPQNLNNVLLDLVETFSDYECDDEPCETCGDYVETYTWEI